MAIKISELTELNATPATGDMIPIVDVSEPETKKINRANFLGTVLQIYAGINPSANVQSLLGAADYAAIRALLDLEVGTDFLSPAAVAASNVATATALQTARTINGVSFNGTANITVTAAAGTLTGTTLNSSVVTSSITTLGSSASLPGNPTTTTQSAGDNTTRIATTQFVQTELGDYLLLTGGTVTGQLIVENDLNVSGGVVTSENGFQNLGGTFVTDVNGDTTVNDLTVSGDLIVNGNTVTVNTATVEVEDSLMELAVGNTANSIDIGFYGNYQTAATPLYTGIVWDASALKYRAFTGLQVEPNTTVNTGGTGYSVATFVVNVEGTLNGVTYPSSGTSGGLPYFSATGTIGSSGLLAANALMVGGGSGAAPSTVTTGTGVLSALSTNVGSAGAFITFNGDAGTPSALVGTNITGTATGFTAGTATVANTVSTANEATDTTCFPLFVTASGTQSLQPKNNTGLTYNSNTNNLGCTTFTGALSGNATTATTLATPRAIYGNNFDGSAALTQIIASTYGGTGNGFTAFSGPTTSEKTFTLPNATCTILTTNAAVTVAQGGTGIASGTSGGVPYFSGTTTIASSAALAANAIVIGGGAGVAPSTTTTGSGVVAMLALAADGTDVDAIGTRGSPLVSFSAATNIVASHCGQTLLHPSSDTNNRTLTIQANGTLALETGFNFEVINDSANDVTLAITTDTLVQAGSGTTGSITIPQYATCYVRKIASTRWYATLVEA